MQRLVHATIAHLSRDEIAIRFMSPIIRAKVFEIENCDECCKKEEEERHPLRNAHD
jgi:hypothetical protein